MSHPFSEESAQSETGWMQRAVLLLTGQAFSLLGSSVVQFAIWWWIVLQTRTGSAMLLATLFGVLPQSLVSVFGGPMADRYNRKALIILPDLIIAGVTVLLSVSFALDWASLSLIFVVLLIRSAGGGIQQPAVQSFIPDVVPESKLLRVNAIFGVIDSANRIAAPALAAVLVNLVPLWAILLVDVTTAVIGVGFVAMIRVPRAAVPDSAVQNGAVPDNVAEAQGNGAIAGTTDSAAAHSIAILRRTFADLKAGLAYAMRHAHIKGVILGDALTCLMSVAPMNLTLLLMTREFEGIDLNLGFINLTTASDKLAANELGLSVGMLLGGALMSAIGPKLLRRNIAQMYAVALGIAMVGITVIGLGVSRNLLLYLIIDVLNGVASAVCVGPMRTVMQSESDESMVGRVFGLDTMLSTLGMPLGMLIFAPLADVIPIAWVFIAGGLLTLPVAWYVLMLSRKPVPLRT
ncbi:transporter, major facilitator family protein [Bifidobacterium saguini DSM 23967]|uniref:Transporter, major facilitator family protein n=2 Tax=Bifidobacterium saguini TaxID=762210 RepID=A0A087DF35_9BIFI|nr:MFS transporter [Bifidobacterium saguini]KFI94135.1 transporter, major facilitator family protein [Bifidobacterium saguini DSM 23967]QTB90436.1 MFS transporter [Bifidobacterium saguini]